MKPTEALKRCLRGYATFSGRAPRSEYWWWMLFFCLAMLVLSQISSMSLAIHEGYSGSDLPGITHLLFLLHLAVFLPTLAVTVRRLHDGNWSGWWAASNALGMAMWSLSYAYGAYGLAPLLDLPVVGVLVAVVYLVASVVGMLVLVRMFFTGTRGENRFGPDPLGTEESR